MRRRKSHLIWTASGTLLGLAAVNAYSQTATLSIQASNGYWAAFAATDSGTDNIGLASFAIDVIGTDGVIVTGSYNAAPDYVEREGFFEFPSNGQGGGMYLSTTSGLPGIPGNGIGIAAEQMFFDDHPNAPFIVPGEEPIQGFGKAFPAEIAQGTYSGTSGILTVQPDTSIGAGIQTLNEVSDGQWVGPGNISTDTTFSGSVAIVPEPSDLVFPLLAGVALTRARRKKVLRGDSLCDASNPI
jgi:hypothetical protein